MSQSFCSSAMAAGLRRSGRMDSAWPSCGGRRVCGRREGGLASVFKRASRRGEAGATSTPTRPAGRRRREQGPRKAPLPLSAARRGAARRGGARLDVGGPQRGDDLPELDGARHLVGLHLGGGWGGFGGGFVGGLFGFGFDVVVHSGGGRAGGWAGRAIQEGCSLLTAQPRARRRAPHCVQQHAAAPAA